MRFTKVIAAVAAPLALGGVLLATAGQASAATTAVLTASVQQQTVHAVIHQANAEDTTSGTATSYTDPTYGPVWAYDNVSKKFDVTQTSPGYYAIVETVHGSFTAFSSPNTGLPYDTPISVTGSIDGTNTYYVSPTVAPDPSNLPVLAPAGWHTGDMISALFHGAQVDQGGQSGNLWVFTYKAHGQTMTQAWNTPSNQWGNITG